MRTEASTKTLTFLRRSSGEFLQIPALEVRASAPGRPALSARLELAPLCVGTAPECDLVLAAEHVSRKHASVRLTSAGVLLTDLDSKNGCFISGVRVREAYLELGVEVAIGSARLSVHPAGALKEIPLAPISKFGQTLGHSLPMRALFAQLEQVAASDFPVCLWGETGSGKDLLARAIHDHSPRSNGPYVVLDCSAVSPELLSSQLLGHERGAFTDASHARAGLLEQANGGTLFLDEVGELSPDLQPRLLRALETKKVQRLGGEATHSAEVRVIAATHQNLRARIAQGHFREDLFYRLAGVELTIPPLRERKEDIPLLVQHFLSQASPPRTLTDLPPHSLALFAAHTWPGNVRELRNIVERMLVVPELGIAGPPARKVVPFLEARDASTAQFERTCIQAALARHDGNVSAAARELDVSRQFLHKLILRHGLGPRSGD